LSLKRMTVSPVAEPRTIERMRETSIFKPEAYPGPA
jgi:hypothetical protein